MLFPFDRWSRSLETAESACVRHALCWAWARNKAQRRTPEKTRWKRIATQFRSETLRQNYRRPVRLISTKPDLVCDALASPSFPGSRQYDFIRLVARCTNQPRAMCAFAFLWRWQCPQGLMHLLGKPNGRRLILSWRSVKGRARFEARNVEKGAGIMRETEENRPGETMDILGP